MTVLGFPLGGELRLLPGTLVDEVSGTSFDIPGHVMRLTAAVQPGNSGGPVLDANGKVVGVVFAIELKTRLRARDPGRNAASPRHDPRPRAAAALRLRVTAGQK